MTLENINEDVFHEICKAILDTTCDDERGKPITGHQSIKSLSSTNHCMRKRLEPIVFRSVCMQDSRVGSWYKTLEKLRSAGGHPAVQEYMKHFHIKPQVAEPGSEGVVDGSPQALAALLGSAGRLEKLSIDIPDSEVKSYQLAIEKTKIQLPSVRTLVLGPPMEWMVKSCPHVTKITAPRRQAQRGLRVTQHSYDFVQAVGILAQDLHTFEMEEHWTAELVQSIHETMPNLRSLTLLGWNQYFKLKDLLLPLSKFKGLRTLSLPMASLLGIGFHPPDCGNAYMGEDGEELSLQVEEEERQAEERASRMIFSVCPQLEVLWIGGSTKKMRPKEGGYAAWEERISSNEVNPLFT